MGEKREEMGKKKWGKRETEGENSFQKGGKWKRGGQQQQCGRVKVKREEQLLFPLTS